MHKRAFEDIGWKWEYLANSNDKNNVTYQMCGHICNGGMYTLKQQISHIKRNVKHYDKAKQEDIKTSKKSLDVFVEKSQKRSQLLDV